jgi:hypothetical protein
VANTARLVDDAGNTIVTLGNDALGTNLKSVNLGFPSFREATTPLSGQDGEYDVTQLVGSRAVTAEVEFTDTVSASVGIDLLGGLLHPGRRYWLYVQMDGWARERMIRVRGASFTPNTTSIPWGAQLGWKAPAPLLLDTTLSSQTLSPTAQPGGGMTFPMTFPMTFAPGLVPGAAILSVGGTVNASPVVDIYGPCTSPLFRVVDTGRTMSFTGLTVNQGDYLHIDVQARTINLNSDPNQSQYDRLDMATSQWPTLPPGSPQVVFSPASSSAGCAAVVSWRNSWT